MKRANTLAVLLVIVAALLLFSNSLDVSIQKFKTLTGLQQYEPARSGNYVTMQIPAIDNSGNGVVANLYVETIDGSQGILVDINNIFFFTDTQSSIRTAEEVAERVTGKDLSNTRIVYSVDSPASVIEGESAGAAMTIATIAALENKTLKPNVIITGTIGSDGSIGPVGGIVEKARASKEAGASLLLVPLGQLNSEQLEPTRDCRLIGIINYCEVTYENKKIDMSELGIEVVEVSNVEEAMKYFIQ